MRTPQQLNRKPTPGHRMLCTHSSPHPISKHVTTNTVKRQQGTYVPIQVVGLGNL